MLFTTAGHVRTVLVGTTHDSHSWRIGARAAAQTWMARSDTCKTHKFLHAVEQKSHVLVFRLLNSQTITYGYKYFINTNIISNWIRD